MNFFRADRYSGLSTVNQDNLKRVPLQSSSPSKSRGLKALFNAWSVGKPEKRTENTSFISDNDIYILFLTESWLRPRVDEAKCADLTPSGYSIRSFPRPTRGGGLAVIYRDSLSPHITTSTHFSFNHSSFELAQVSFRLQHRVFHLLQQEQPSRKNKLTEFMFFSQFPDLLDHCDSLPGLLCILGDFNFHLDQPRNPNISKFLDLLCMHSLHQLVDQPTHRPGHTVDLVIERPDDGFHRSTEVFDALASDHMCVITQLDVTVTPHAPVYRVARNLRDVNQAAFNEVLQAELGSLTDPTADQLDTTQRIVLDKHAPASRRRVSTRKLTDQAEQEQIRFHG